MKGHLVSHVAGIQYIVTDSLLNSVRDRCVQTWRKKASLTFTRRKCGELGAGRQRLEREGSRNSSQMETEQPSESLTHFSNPQGTLRLQTHHVYLPCEGVSFGIGAAVS